MEIEKLLEIASDEVSDQSLDRLIGEARRRLNRALKPIRRPLAAVGVIESPLGRLLIATGERGVVMVRYLDGTSDLGAVLENLGRKFDPVEDERAVAAIGVEISRYLAGDQSALRHQADLSMVENAFQRKVLGKLMNVPRGALISYQALGAASGVQHGARAVGNAMHDNPVPIYVPCHRVICSDGRIGGYAGGGGRKLALLRSEGFAVSPSAQRIPASVVWGHRQTRIFCRQDCRTAARADRSRMIFFADPIEARRAGMRACKICQPG